MQCDRTSLVSLLVFLRCVQISLCVAGVISHPQCYWSSCNGNLKTPCKQLKLYDTAVIGWITNNDEKVYLEEAVNLSLWWKANSLLLKVSKIKEQKVDCRRQTPLQGLASI